MLLIAASSSIATTLSLSLPTTSTTTTIVLLRTIYPPTIYATLPGTHITSTTTVRTNPCPLPLFSAEVTSSKLIYVVGENIIIYWSGFGGTANGNLMLVGPSGTYPYNLNQNEMAAGNYETGPTQVNDVGYWTATLTVLGPPGCPPVAEDSTQFQVTPTPPPI